ncbi:tyrosine-type recombinase/integrase [Nocardia sp. CA-151230]|uniref:tyrosine-type recombinase/integrase n=1 Tax=Nocardia sp. CA-151230 TaxID=3239982 RepID=UPI003D8E649D
MLQDGRAFPIVGPHDLRHTAASLATGAGANPKAVQAMLGHKSAAMTPDTSADLFPDDPESVADALDTAARSALAKAGTYCGREPTITDPNSFENANRP